MMVSSWRLRLESLSWTPPGDPGGRVLVLSAHPDDVVLAVGGWLAGQTKRDITFVTATASRTDELVSALRVLGFAHPDVRRLGLPDDGVADSGDALAEGLATYVEQADLVLAPFEADGHPAHDAVGAAAVRLCGDHTTTLWRFPLWTWTWTTPAAQPWLPDARRLDCSSAARVRKRRAVAALETPLDPSGDPPADAAVGDGLLLRHALYAPEVVLT
jgi:LmbE family N-acetylglucosaminyl deacetylase